MISELCVVSGATVRTAAANAEIEKVEFVAALSRVALVVFSLMIALEQLMIGRAILTNSVLIAVGGISLAGALTVGLGAQEIAAEYLEQRFGKR